MVFLWFSYGFSYGFFYGFPMVFLWFFLWFSYGLSYGFPMVFLWFFLWFSYGFSYGLKSPAGRTSPGHRWPRTDEPGRGAKSEASDGEQKHGEEKSIEYDDNHHKLRLWL